MANSTGNTNDASNDPLLIDTELRQKPKSLQPKVIYAGDVWTSQPYASIQEDAIILTVSKTNSISMSEKFGTTIGGKISFSMMPDQIALGGGYWRLNPLLLSSLASTTPTPIPVLIKSTPRLLAAKSDISNSVSNILSQSNSSLKAASKPHTLPSQ